MDTMKESMYKMEREKRRNNVIIQEMEITTYNQDDLKQKLKDLFYENWHLEIRMQPIQGFLVEVHNKTYEEKVMVSNDKLRQSREKIIYKNDYMDEITREIQKEVRIRPNKKKQGQRWKELEKDC